jgi:hypothetical protein
MSPIALAIIDRAHAEGRLVLFSLWSECGGKTGRFSGPDFRVLRPQDWPYDNVESEQ